MKQLLPSTYVLYGLIFSFFCALVGYSVWSFGLTDPNLVISNNQLFWQFQQWAWQTLFHNRPLQTYTYIAIICLLVLIYSLLLWWLKHRYPHSINQKNWWKYALAYIVLVSPLIFSNNALSHDVFNYMFNAKMVIEYQADPHQRVALDFSYDPWTRYMHNTHTPAPYWYGWTMLSLLPYLAGFGSFLVTWINFRLFSLLGLLFFAGLLWYWQHLRGASLQIWQLAMVLLNPLVLIELISNAHNDVWMLLPAAASFLILLKPKKMHLSELVSLICLVFSISTKYATSILMPYWLLSGLLVQLRQRRLPVPVSLGRNTAIFLKGLWAKLTAGIHQSLALGLPFVLSVTMFILLLIPRSRWFLPWYLVWSLLWIPLLLPQKKDPRELTRIDRAVHWLVTPLTEKISWWWVVWLLSLSVSSLFRYVPWIWNGGYAQPIATQEIIITWIGAGCVLLLFRSISKSSKSLAKLLQ